MNTNNNLKQNMIHSDKKKFFENFIAGGKDIFLTIDETSSYLRVTVSTLYSWIHQRKIPFRKHGRKVVFNKQELDDWSKNKSFALIPNEPNHQKGG